MRLNMVTPKEAIVAEAKRLGFESVGVARADLPLDADYARYRAFVDRGMHGEMGWLAENGDARERVDGEAILAGAKSVVCLARRYARGANEDADGTARSIA